MVPHFFAFLISLIQIQNVYCQVCQDTKMIWRTVPESYQYTYMEAYEKPDCLFWCTDTRVATAVGTRNIKKLVPEQINTCCEGYVTEESNNNTNSLHCKPLCSPACVNGYCKAPGVCACHHGYLPDLFDRHICIPVCIKGCEHGICKAPNTCECDPGYKVSDQICKPICSEPCNNGTCIAPEKCQCLSGYRKNDEGKCEPYCSSYTASGECVTSITCESGWAKLIKGSLEICQPICSNPCINGTCVAPETCECLSGYVNTTFGTCAPYCDSECLHGNCISPGNCICEPGWYKKEASGDCFAHCDHCGNGTCVAPNVCECSPGFVLVESKRPDHECPVCVAICENCEELCTKLEECACVWPLEPIYLTAAGSNCSSGESRCERMVCYMTTTSSTTTTTTTTTTSTTSTINPNDVFATNTDTTESISKDVVNAETASIEWTSGVGNSENIESELEIDKASWYNSSWFYGVSGSLLATIFIVIMAGILGKKYSMLFPRNQRNIFDLNNDDASPVVHYKKTSSCT